MATLWQHCHVASMVGGSYSIIENAAIGIQDGKIFDYVSQTTPTGGKDQGFLEQVLTGTVGMGANPFGG